MSKKKATATAATAEELETKVEDVKVETVEAQPEEVAKKEPASEVVATVTKPEKAKAKTGTVVYIGPTISLVAASNTIYNNGITEALEAKAKEHPFLRALIVPLEDYAVSLCATREAKSALNLIYNKAKTLNK